MSGPPRKPTVLRLVQGNPSKRAINEKEPQPEKGIPKTPSFLNKQGRYWFDRLAKELNIIGVITTLDTKALELLVEAYCEYRHHCDVLDEEGYTFKTKSTTGEDIVKAHPAVVMKSDAWKRIRAMLGEFGMTPASRSKVNANGESQEDPLDAFLNRKRK